MQDSDKDYSVSWFDAPFPADVSRAETFIKDENKNFGSRTSHLIIAQNDDDTIVGRIANWSNGRMIEVSFHMNPVRDDTDTLKAETLGIIIPWLIDEGSFLCVTVGIAADEPASIAAAGALGMVPSVRMREYIARPGHRVDLIYYQALGAPWRLPEEVNHA